MKSTQNFYSRGTIFPAALFASAIIGLLTLTGLYILPIIGTPTQMTLSPSTTTALIDTSFTVQVLVTAQTPVNAFAGLLKFDPNILKVARIDYNTSIADLWAEEPWYKEGSGTISFAGGSTKSGGFEGNGTLVTITFTALTVGDAKLALEKIQILQHDGLGTEAAERDSITTMFTVISSDETTISATPEKTFITVLSPATPLDLNNDQKVTISDISIFMLYLTQSDLRADFNQDGKVGAADLSILLNARS